MSTYLVFAGFMGLGAGELAVIFAILLLLFGGAKLPQLGSSLGSAIRNFKRGFNGEDDKKDQDNVAQLPGQNVQAASADQKAKDATKA